VLLASIFLALVPLLGIIYILTQGLSLTVDNLFSMLILLLISGVFGTNAALELRQRKLALRDESAGGTRMVGAGSGLRTERGLVESVLFYESLVGHPDKSIVSLLPNGSKAVRMIPFEGDLRNQLPVGHYVEFSYRPDGESNRVVDLKYK
jgi:hypothetical protein